VAAVGSPQDVNLFLQHHPFTHLLGDSGLGFGVGFDDLDHFALAVHQNAASLIDVVGSPLGADKINLPHNRSRPGKRRYDGNFYGIAGGNDRIAGIKIRHVGYFSRIVKCETGCQSLSEAESAQADDDQTG